MRREAVWIGIYNTYNLICTEPKRQRYELKEEKGPASLIELSSQTHFHANFLIKNSE